MALFSHNVIDCRIIMGLMDWQFTTKTLTWMGRQDYQRGSRQGCVTVKCVPVLRNVR
jgi:hypothetical protein